MISSTHLDYLIVYRVFGSAETSGYGLLGYCEHVKPNIHGTNFHRFGDIALKKLSKGYFVQ